MKKTIAFLLAMIFLFGCVACSGEKNPQISTPDSNQNPPADGPTDGSVDDTTDENKQEDNKIMLPMPEIRPLPKDPVGEIDGISREVAAILAVARAYLARTTANQYEDSKMTTTEYWFLRDIKDQGIAVDTKKYSPESATSQHTYYSSCSPFVKSVFFQAWGVDLTDPNAWTAAEIAKAEKYCMWSYEPTGKETSAEKEKIKNEFLSTLIPGDVISLCKNGPSGHILIYAGNNWVIHSTNYKAKGGGNYDQTNNAAKIEVDGAVEYYDITKVFESGEKYAFWDYEIWSILRPTSYIKNIQITEQTKLRMENLIDIYVEKISSHPIGTTAQIGEEITYGFYLRNDRTEKATVELKDVVPENTTYVSGAWELDGENMSWSVTLEPGEEKMICYTVKVNEDQALYENGVIVSDKATAGGVDLPCNNIYIGKKLDDETLNKIERAYTSAIATGRSGIELAKTIYQKSGLKLDLPEASEILSSLFVSNNGGYKLNANSEYYKMVVPTLYGGYATKGNDDKKGDRNQFIDYTLMAGDILVCKEGTAINVYMCVGEGKIMNLAANNTKVYEGEDYKKIVYSVYGQDVYAVLRPALD